MVFSLTSVQAQLKNEFFSEALPDTPCRMDYSFMHDLVLLVILCNFSLMFYVFVYDSVPITRS